MSDFPVHERIRVLLAEHATLRAEIIARIGHAYQLMAVGAASIAFLAGTAAPSSYSYWICAAAVTAVIALGFWTFMRDMRKAGARIREIELDVNDRAQEDLLVWENVWGGEITGYFGPAHPMPRSHLAMLPKPVRTWRGVPIRESSPKSD